MPPPRCALAPAQGGGGGVETEEQRVHLVRWQ
jgi:hypothetical protein